MYTNGLKDRYGSPLLSLDVGDERYVRMNQIEFEHNKLEEKITLLDRNVQRNADDITKANDRLHNINVTVKNHIDDQDVHFTEGEKKDFHSVVSVVDEYCNGFTIGTLAETATGSGEVNAVHYPAATVPHEQPIEQIVLPVLNSCSSPYYLAVWTIDGSDRKTYRGLSDNAITWTEGTNAIWNFVKNPITVPTGHRLEIYITDGEGSVGNREANVPAHHIKLYTDGSNTGTIRKGSGWWPGGNIRTEFRQVGKINKHIGDDSHLTPDEKTEVQNLVNDVYLTVEDAANTYATKENVERDLGYSYKISEDANTIHDVNAINIISSKLPHNIVFDEIRIPAENTSQNSYYLAIWSVIDGRKTSLGHSDEAVRWSAGEDAVWSFKNSPFSIPDNANLEIFLAATLDDIKEGNTNVPSEHITCRYISGNRYESGSIRQQSWWQFSRNTFVILRKTVHIGDETHLSGIQREVLNEIVTNGFVAKNQFDILVEQTKQKQQYYDTWTNLKDGYFVDKAACYSFQLDKLDFVSGRIDRIEIPYAEGANAEGHLCVQFFDSSNSIIATHYSINTQKQDKTGNNVRGICEFEFMTFETPDEYSYVRFSMVANTTVVPTGNSGKQFRMMPIGYGTGSNRFVWNTNTNTKINNTGLGWTILLSVLTRKIGKDTGITIRQYDWTPDVFCPINVTLSTAGNAFVAPTNGWIVSKSTQTTSGANSLTLNGIEIGASGSTAQADLQVMMRKGQFVTATTAYNLVFFPCKSEQFDYRLENTHTKYDIWKGAIIYDENGESSVQDLYIPNANTWKNEVGHEVIGSIARIEDEKAYDSNGYVLFNIQSQYIENGNHMFIQSSITSFDANLDALISGAQMFAGARLTSWNTDLPSLTSGETMFYACPNLSSFRADVHSLTTGWNMFMNCSNLTTVSFVNGLGALTDGTGMFKSCSLNYTSLYNILAALPTRNGNVIEITVADSVKDDMLNDPQWEGVSIPAHNSGNYYGFTHNGWNVRLTSRTGFSLSSSYDVSEVNGYIPDASQWKSNVYTANNLNIVSVVDGVAYDGLV